MEPNPRSRFSALHNAIRPPLQAAISCFTRQTLLIEPAYRGAETVSVRLSGNEPVQLGRHPGLSFRLAQTYRVGFRGGAWELQTTRYAYWLLDRQGRELLLYQWNPVESSKVTTPHLHIRALAMLTDVSLPGGTADNLIHRLVRAHLPTGHITLGQILGVAVDDLGVEPLETDATKVRQRLTAADAASRASFAWLASP